VRQGATVRVILSLTVQSTRDGRRGRHVPGAAQAGAWQQVLQMQVEAGCWQSLYPGLSGLSLQAQGEEKTCLLRIQWSSGQGGIVNKRTL